MRAIIAPLSALVTLALLAPGCGGKDESSEVSGGNGKNDGSAATGGNLVLGNGNGNGQGGNGLGNSGVVVDPKAACAKGSASAALSGVNMFVMFDRSSSMNQKANPAGETRWQLTSAALNAFFASPDAGGLNLALRFFPHDKPGAGCNQDDCSTAACSMPLVGLATLTAEAAPADAHEKALIDATAASAPGMAGQGTPIFAALGGALEWAAAEHQQKPTESSVVVLVTDGQANGCDQNIGHIAALAKAALAADGTRTYAIGLTGSQEDDMDRIAEAGGTTKGIFVSDGANTQKELLDALGAIRGQVLDCDFPMPVGKPGVVVDKDQINVNFTPSSGAQSTLTQVADDKGCAAGGWYYDNGLNPSRIILCKSTCDTVTADPAAKLDILLGCATVTSVPR